MTAEYTKDQVVGGTRDYLAYHLKRPVGKVEGRGRKIIVHDTMPEDVEEELRKILPDEYELEIRSG